MKFVFFYESQELAGAEVQMIKIINNLIKIGHEVQLYDKGNVIFENCEGVNKREYNEVVENVDYLIYFACDVINIRKKLKISAVKNEVVWCVHPDNYLWIFPLFNKMRKINKRASNIFLKIFYPFRYLNVKKILLNPNTKLFFMDGMNYQSFKSIFNFEVQYRFLPIVPSVDVPNKETKKINNDLKILYVGRLVDFKVKPLVSFIHQISKSACFRKYEIHIVGSGECDLILKREKFQSNVELKFFGNKYNAGLFETARNCDLAFAMGTSSLDISMMGLPVILSPLDTNLNKYIWLYETEKFNMIATEDNFKLRDIKEILSEFKESKYKIVNSCQSYTSDNHTVINVINSLISE